MLNRKVCLTCCILREKLKFKMCRCNTEALKPTDINDNCPDIANPDQKNSDKDAYGDACDCDEDGDGTLEKCNFTDADGDGIKEYSICSLPR